MAEKNINDISRDARTLFAKAAEAAQRQNTDYAIDLFNQVLQREPEFYAGRKALRAEQFKKAGGGGGGFFKKMMSGAGSSPPPPPSASPGSAITSMTSSSPASPKVSVLTCSPGTQCGNVRPRPGPGS